LLRNPKTPYYKKGFANLTLQKKSEYNIKRIKLVVNTWAVSTARVVAHTDKSTTGDRTVAVNRPLQHHWDCN